MPTLTQLILYPIKSCAGIALSEATLTEAGLMHEDIYDREWMVVDLQGNFLTQREYPRMALIRPRIRAETLEVRMPGMMGLDLPLDLPHPDDAHTIEVKVWNDTVPAYDCDELTATWFSKALGTPCRLVRFHPETRRIASLDWTGGVEAPTMFADGFPLLVISRASLDDLNGKLQARIQPVKPCPRCPIPSVDQATGEVGPDPLDILRSYRVNPRVNGGIAFGMNAIVRDGAGEVLRVGQEIEVELAL